MPASEAVDFEREFAEVVRELRALPSAAPQGVREHVRALGEPEPRRALRLPHLSWRRAGIALAAACVLAVVSAAAVHGLLSSSPTRQAAVTLGEQGSATRAPNLANPRRTGGARAPDNQTLQSGFGQDLNARGRPSLPAPNPARHQDYEADLRVRVKDADTLGQQTARAMQITQQLGGYVASVSQSTNAGQPGEADLVLRVPVARVDDAMIRLSALGTVLAQNVSIVDLERVVQQQRRRIQTLQLQIARLTAALQQPGLAPDVKLNLQFQLDNARRSLSDVIGSNKATLREAALSRISLSLTSQRPAPAKHHIGPFGRAASDALDFLSGAGAVTLAALIILSPLLAIVALLVWGVRTYRRREAQRLLGTT